VHADVTARPQNLALQLAEEILVGGAVEVDVLLGEVEEPRGMDLHVRQHGRPIKRSRGREGERERGREGG